jgi:hypothetical protein
LIAEDVKWEGFVYKNLIHQNIFNNNNNKKNE